MPAFALSFEAEAAASTLTLTNNGYGVIKAGSSSRISGDNLNLTNDAQADNTSAGVIRFELPALSNYIINSATLNAVIDSYSAEARETSFYWSTGGNCGTYINNTETKLSLSTGGWYTGVNSLLGAFGIQYTKDTSYHDAPISNQRIGNIAHGNTSVNSFDITDALKAAVENEVQYFYIVCLKAEAGSTGKDGDWTDTHVVASRQTISINVSEYEDVTDCTKEVFGNVSIDPIIFTHGTFTGDMHDIADDHQYDYMMNGSRISDGTYPGETYTKVSSKKVISFIKAVENGTVVKTKDVKLWDVDGTPTRTVLSGNLGAQFSNVTATTPSQVTLKFIFTDGTFELHRLPVITNPVAEHTISVLFAWCQPFGTFRYPTPFEVLAYGSYGQLGTTGSYTFTTESLHKGNTQSVNRNFASMYSYNSAFDSWEDSSTVYMDSMTNDAVTYDKQAGFYFGYTYKDRTKQTLNVNSPVATYYLDLSQNDNYGVNYSTSDRNNFSIKMYVSSIYWNDDKNNEVANITDRSVAISSGNSTLSIGSVDSAIADSINIQSKSVGFVTLNGTPALGTTSAKFVTGYCCEDKGNDCDGTNIINTNINLIVSDKTTQREGYNTLMNELKTLRLSCFTEESLANYRNALLALESWLNNNTNTDMTEGASLLTAAQEAKANLVYSDAANHDYNGEYVQGTGANVGKHARKCTYNCGDIGNVVLIYPTQGYQNCSYTQQVVSDEYLKTPATCTAPAVYYKSCLCGYSAKTDSTATFTSGSATGHRNVTHVSAMAATCTENGKIEYWYCNDCATYFSDSECSNIISQESTVTPATGHAWAANAETDGSGASTLKTNPTCTRDAVYYKVCSNCHESSKNITGETWVKENSKLPHTFGDDWTTITEPTCTQKGLEERMCLNCDATEQREIAMIEHMLDVSHRVEPTCTANGTIQYWFCLVCGKIFSDENGETEITEDEIVLPATGHTYEVTGYTWVLPGIMANVTINCSVCHNDSHEITNVSAVSKTSETPATCTTPGERVYTITATYEGKDYTKTGTVEIPATGHTSVTPTEAKEANCVEEGNIAYRYCSACNKYFSDSE